MAALTGNSIDSSYQGLIKTTDNGAISGTAKAVTDGLGNATNIEISNTATNFVSGTVDFTGATVSGLPGGSAGLVTGGQTNSMKSDASLTTTAAVTAHEGDIVIGEDAESKVSSGTDDYNEGGAIAIGVGATVDKVVDYNFADTKGGIALGINAKANSGVNEGGSIAMGENSKAEGTSSSIAIGSDAHSRASFDISIGHGANTTGTGIAIGKDAEAATGGWGIAIGESAGADAGGFRTGAIAIGNDNTASAEDSIVVGNGGSATAAGAVALGHDVTAATANTVSVSALETQTDGGVSIKGDGTNAGKLKLFCEDASGAHNITLEGPAHSGGSTYTLKFPNTQSAGSQILEADSSGNLSWVNTPSAGAAGLESGSGSDSMQSASSLTSADPANASGNESIALGYGAEATGNRSVSIGIVAQDNGYQKGVAIGNSARNNGEEATAIGTAAQAKQNAFAGGKAAEAGENSVAIGNSANNAGINDAVAIGLSSYVGSNSGVAIGSYQQAINEGDVVIGDGNSMASKTYFEGDVVIGRDNASSTTNGGRNVLIGDNNTVSQNERCNLIGSENSAARGDHSILGYNNTTQTQYNIAVVGNQNTASGEKSVVAGHNSSATATGAVALGDGVTAATAQTVSVKALETQTNSTPTAGGIIMNDAGGTARRINIDSSGNLQVDSNSLSSPKFTLPKTTATSATGCDVIISSTLIPANTFAAGDILQLSGAMSASGSNATIYSAYWISNTGTVGGSATEEVNCGQLALSNASWSVGFQKNLYIHTADGTGDATQLVSGMAYSDVDGSYNNQGMQTYTPDWTSDLYLVNRSCVTAGNNATLIDHGAVLKKIN